MSTVCFGRQLSKAVFRILATRARDAVDPCKLFYSLKTRGYHNWTFKAWKEIKK